MLKNYLKIAFRNLLKYKNHSLINILGLAIGTACCILIALYILHELNYEHFIKNSDKIYRISMSLTINGKIEKSATIEYPIAPLLREYPEVKDVARIINLSQNMIGQIPAIHYGDKSFYEERFYFADSTFFRVIDFPLLYGNSFSALNEPNSVVITKKIAHKYFGNESPLGKILRFNNRIDLKVTGVLDDFPGPTHIEFDFLASMDVLPQTKLPNAKVNFSQNWILNWFYTYVILENSESAPRLESRLTEFVRKNYPEVHRQNQVKLYVQPIKEIHLYSDYSTDITESSDINYVIIFGIIGGLVLAIACINFINLTLAQFTQRTRELGIRKVLGAFRRQLIFQIFIEAALLTLFACIAAWLIIELTLPLFGSLTGINDYPLQILPFALIFMPFIVLLTGIYPGLVFSSLKPGSAMKDSRNSFTKGAGLRKVLVVFQFSASVVLITGTIIVYQQLYFMESKDPGFYRQHMMMIPLRDSRVEKQFEVFKNQLLRNPNIADVSGINGKLGQEMNYTSFEVEGIATPQIVFVCRVEQDFIKTLGLKLIAGRDFSREIITDEKEAYIINEAAMHQFGWNEAIGRKIKFATMPGAVQGTIIGVVKDFHYMPMHKSIAPLVISKGFFGYAIIKIRGNNLPETISYIKAAWNGLDSDKGFTYSFLDDILIRNYKTEDQISRLTAYFSGLAIFIACLGLLGLVSFTSLRRTKEIGIRKVLGATVYNVVILLTKEFLKLVLISNLIAWPLAFLAVTKWLDNFAYKIELNAWPFLAAALIAFLFASVTIIFQAIKAALANPVKSIRYE